MKVVSDDEEWPPMHSFKISAGGNSAGNSRKSIAPSDPEAAAAPSCGGAAAETRRRQSESLQATKPPAALSQTLRETGPSEAPGSLPVQGR